MNILLTALKYIKRYPLLTWVVLVLIIISSFFEGVSFGMLIPLIGVMTGNTTGLFEKVPLFGHSGFSFSGSEPARAASFILLLIFLVLLVKNIFLYFSKIFTAKLRFGIIRDLRKDLMSNILEYDMKYFDRVKIGNIVGVINTETGRMGDFILAVLAFATNFTRVVAYAILLFLISWKASIVIFALMLLVLFPIELIIKNIKKIGAEASQVVKEYNHKLIEILQGIRLIKICGTEEIEKNEFNNITENEYYLSYKNNINIHLIIPLSEVFIFGLITLCFFMLINIIKIDIKNSFPFIATYLLALVRMLTQLNVLNGNRSTAVSSLAAFENYENIYNEEGKKTILSGDKKIGRECNSIEFKNVSFSYAETDRYVLSNCDIKIPKGKMTAFVGSSGAGKSTIVNLIVRFYDVESGEILVDGINLKELVLKEWRRKIGFVSQDIFIFNCSVKDNISYGHKDVLDEEIVRAAKAANAHNFITELPNGYDTILGERGVRLSGGQKQRVSIARAIIHNPEILILDEATSSLDTETERLIKEAIGELAKDRTVIAIAHRLSTILHADKIIVLNKGTIVETGNHEDLLISNGIYRKLYEAQFDI